MKKKRKSRLQRPSLIAGIWMHARALISAAWANKIAIEHNRDRRLAIGHVATIAAALATQDNVKWDTPGQISDHAWTIYNTIETAAVGRQTVSALIP